MYYLGIDISKQYFDAMLLTPAGEKHHRRFDNTQPGIQACLTWLQTRGVSELHGCMEATNSYWEDLAEALHQAQYTVSVVNPARIKGYAMSQMRRSKNDKLDSDVIVTFCAQTTPEAWKPLTDSARKIRNLARHRDSLQKTLTQQKNRLANSRDETVTSSLQRIVETLEAEIKQIEQKIDEFIDSDSETQEAFDLMCSIVGIGAKTARKVLAEMPDIAHYKSASAVAADAGVTPAEHASGDTVRRRTRISKMGKASIRGALYWPAISAMKHNPPVAAFAQRLRARGKPEKVIIVAVIRKLIHIIYGVLKNKKPFDPNHGIKALVPT
jgi:transposase